MAGRRERPRELTRPQRMLCALGFHKARSCTAPLPICSSRKGKHLLHSLEHTTPKGTPKGNPKGGKALGYGKGYRPKTTYVTEDPDGEEEVADEEEDEPYQGEDAEGEEEPDDEVEALAAELETLTVTANKLKSLTQARRFGAPSGKGGGKSIDQRKAVTQCKICGQTGHWRRECPNNKGGTKPPAPTKGMRTRHATGPRNRRDRGAGRRARGLLRVRRPLQVP